MIAGWVCLIVSIALFIIGGIGWEPFGTPPDFGPLPLALLAIAGWGLFQLNIVRLLRGALDVTADNGDGDEDATPNDR